MTKAAKSKVTKKKETGKPVKLSLELTSFLDPFRIGKESYDAILRRYFGLPSRTGHLQPLQTYYVVDTPNDLIIRRTKAEAKGETILLAVKRGQKFSSVHYPKKDKVIVVREVPS